MRGIGVGLLLWVAGCLQVGSGVGASGSSGAASSGGSLGPTCGPSAHYLNDVCVLDVCGPGSPIAACQLADGGFGTCAAGTCLSTANDSKNCGLPGASCSVGGACVNGVCWVSVDAGWFTGFCGNCPAGAECLRTFCLAQVCGPGDDDRACGRGYGAFCCHGACISSDGADCGGCDATCPAGLACGQFGCVGAVSCAGDAGNAICRLSDGRAGTCCGGACTDSQWDSADCGGCGLLCPTAISCDGGLCRTGAPPATSCDTVACPSGTSCTAPFADQSFSPPPPVCVASACPATEDGETCLLGETHGTCCGGQCVSFLDRASCGGCAIACAPSDVCVGVDDQFDTGHCVGAPPCVPGGPSCIIDGGVGYCCGQACVDVGWDPLNCNGCGLGCSAGGTCEQGECQYGSGSPNGCADGGLCPEGEVCVDGWCSSGRCDGTSDSCLLPDGTGTCCGAKCADIESDLDDCVGCGVICPSGALCSSRGCVLAGGSAAPCPAFQCPAGSLCTPYGFCVTPGDCSPAVPQPTGPIGEACWLASNKQGACCDGECVDLNQDPENCGFCGLTCPSGFCATIPNSFPFDGAVYELLASCLPSEPSSDCLATCGEGMFCLQGACTSGAPRSYGGVCLASDGTIGVSCAPGVCAHPRDDSLNCGVCGNTCPTGVACVAGNCAGATCGLGHWGDFCGDAGERICCPGADCTDTQTDPVNCGFCGNQCPPGTSCSAGACR